MEADVELTTWNVLVVWIEEQKDGWAERKAFLLESPDGQFCWPMVGSDGKLNGTMKLFFAPDREMVWPPDEDHTEDYLPLLISPDIGIDHCKVLIENAVEQVAGR